MHHIRISNHAAKHRAAAASGASQTQRYYSRALFEANVDAIVVTDAQGVITDVNQQMVALTGCARSDLIGSSWFCFCPDPVQASVAFARALTDDRAVDVELDIKSRMGKETTVTYHAAPIYNGRTKLVGVFATLRDVSELNCLKRELATKQIELDRASQIKSDFLATMSHELRTPLTAILGFSEALLCGLLGKIADEQKEYVQDINDSGLHLLKLINDILDLSKINAGMMQLNLETADIGNLLAHSVSHNAQRDAAHEIEVKLDDGSGPLVAQLDLRKTQQIIDHMLSNAKKFSAPNGNVKIHACRVPRSAVGQLSTGGATYGHPLRADHCDEFVQLVVHDNGVGIAHENLPMVYDLFTQIDSGLDRRHEGVGLGVSMVQQLAELHGGTTAIASIPGEGTSFAVWLPVRNDAADLAGSTGMPH